MLSKLSNFKDIRGSLSVIETKDIPFTVKRLFLVTDMLPGIKRGEHGHRNEEQLIICIKGSVDVNLINKDGNFIQNLSERDIIYIPNLNWCEYVPLTNDTTILVLCSSEYDPNDYIYDMDEFKQLIKEGKDEN